MWRPIQNRGSYLEINLKQQEPVYGSVVWGYQKTNEFVTSYKVAYSNDGVIFTYVKDANGRDAVSN